MEKNISANESDLLDYAWAIIANAGGGDWSKESKMWQDAATEWRDKYHALIKRNSQN